MTGCVTIQGLISAGLDGEATAEETKAVESHLAGCAACRIEAERLEALRDLVFRSFRQDPGPAPPPWFASRVAAQAELRPAARRWRLAWPALAVALAGLALAIFYVARPGRQELMSVYELKPAAVEEKVVVEVASPPPVEHYLMEHARQASSVPPVESQGLVEYVGYNR